MAVLVWASLLQGLAVLLAAGFLLTVGSVFLPRLLSWWEKREAARLGLERGAPALPVREKPAATPAAPEAAPLGPGPAPRPPAAAPGPAAEEPLVAAAIALALTLYQQEQRPAPARPREEGVSPWALAGRWQAMARRQALPKR